MFLKIHNIQIPIPLSGPWQVLEKSLQVFHPLRPLQEQMINPSGSTEIDVLVIQLVALAALLWFPQSFNQEWTEFVDKLSSVIDCNPLVLKVYEFLTGRARTALCLGKKYCQHLVFIFFHLCCFIYFYHSLDHYSSVTCQQLLITWPL